MPRSRTRGLVSRRTLVVLVLLLAAVGALLVLGRRRPPNIILISIDSLRPDHLGCYGYGRETSPTIDRLAREGALFETAVSTTSWTLPAHAALFTALADSVHFCNDDQKWLDGSRFTLAESLKAAGYATAGFYSGPYLHPSFGFAQGFDFYKDCTSYSARSIDLIKEEKFVGGEHNLLNQDLMRAAHEARTNPIVLDAVKEWLGTSPRRPFFLFIHLWDVHYDYVAPPEYVRRFAPDYQGPVDGRNVLKAMRKPANWSDADVKHLEALYDAEIRYTDDTLGEILAEIDRRGLKETSIIAVTADHGEAFYEHGHHGHRWTLYDEEIRIPLVIRCPAGVSAGRRIQRPASIVDIAPTLLDLAGLPPLPHPMGRSLAPLFAPLLGSAAVPWSDVTAVCELTVPANKIDSLALRERARKIIYDETQKKILVYDLAADPGEQNPLGPDGAGLSLAEIDGMRVETRKLLLEKRLELPEIGERDTPPIPDMTEEQLRAHGYLR